MQSSKFDTIIVGGGLLGLTVGWRLADAGQQVAIVDSGPSSSAAAGGMLAPSFEAVHHRAVPSLIPLLFDSLKRWPHFSRDIEQAANAQIGYDLNGIVGIGFDRALEGGVRADIPSPFPGADDAQFVPGQGQVDPRPLLSALKRACAASGVVIISARAIRWTDKGDEIHLITDENDALLGKSLVLAVGAADAILPASVPKPIPVRGRAFRLRCKRTMPNFVVRAPEVYFCPKSDGTLYVGATEEPPSQAGDGPLEDLWERALAYCPSLSEADILGQFDGLRPASPTGTPIIQYGGADERVVVATGLDRNGVMLTPWAAAQVLELLDASPSISGSCRAEA